MTLKLFLSDPYQYAIDHDVKDLVKIAKIADKAYYNTDKSKMSDEEYDLLRNLILEADPNNAYIASIGASVSEKVKVTLPCHLGSMSKPTGKEIDKFISKFKASYRGPYMLSSKLDGVSGLLEIINGKKNLFTRGDGTIGTDITNLVPYVVPDIDTSVDYLIRGELIMSIKDFEKYEDEKANARNTVSGVVNAKTVREDELGDIVFIAYEVIEPWLPFDKQMELLKSLEIQVVDHEFIDDFDKDLLIEKYREYTNTEYECDGIIISQNNPEKRNTSGNPKYAFAFKNMDDLQTAIVTVKEIIWQISKDGYINPVIHYNPVKLSGAKNHRATAFNAKYIYDNMLGPGSVIEIVRSGGVIPYIKRVIKGSKAPQMPEYDYVWNSTEVDIITTEYSIEQKVRELEKFFKELKIKNVAKQSIEKFIEADIDTVPKIMSITKEQLRKVSSYKTTMVDKIYNAIHERMKTITLADLMVASNLFGHGMGRRMIEKIIKEYPDIVFRYIENDYDEFEQLILNIDGFAGSRTEWFQSGMKPFLDMLQHTCDEIQDRILFEFDIQESTDELNGKKFVFTGFRDADWEKMITDKGGSITSSVSKNTFAIVTPQVEIDNATNNKVKKALDLGCTIIAKENFLEYMETIEN